MSDQFVLTKRQNEGRTTVDEKPKNLLLHNARPRTRAGSAPPAPPLAAPNNNEVTGWASGTTYATPYPMHPPFAPPNAIGPYYPHYPQPTNPNPPFHAPPTTHIAPSDEKSPHDYPDIITWCQYLDSHKGRNKDGIVFKPFGALLKKKGFIRITQLTSGFVELKDLQEWLGIEVGTAIFIMQYAKADVQAIDNGKLFFPHREDEST